ncbi:MAG: flavodoxin family protein [Candidatus Hodarchaeota archaeon]
MAEKVLVVYYSLTGNTKLLAETIAASINSDILGIKPVKELNPDNIMKYLWGGYQAVMSTKPKLEAFEINPLEYDVLFIGTPVWAWKHSPPINSFIKKHDLSGKKVALFTCGGDYSPKAMMRFKKAIPDGVDIIGEIQFREGKLKEETDEEKQRVSSWAKDLLEKS